MKLALNYNSLTGKYDLKVLHKMLKKMIVACVAMGSVYGFAASHIRFVLNATPSIPHKFFVLLRNVEPSFTIPKKDRYVLFDHSVVNTRVIKQVKGVPGSRIQYDAKGDLWVDEFCVGKPHTVSRTGQLIHAIKPGIIPEGYVFAYAPHDRSFDSRYEEFGLIPVQSIQGVGVAIL